MRRKTWRAALSPSPSWYSRAGRKTSAGEVTEFLVTVIQADCSKPSLPLGTREAVALASEPPPVPSMDEVLPPARAHTRGRRMNRADGRIGVEVLRRMAWIQTNEHHPGGS